MLFTKKSQKTFFVQKSISHKNGFLTFFCISNIQENIWKIRKKNKTKIDKNLEFIFSNLLYYSTDVPCYPLALWLLNLEAAVGWRLNVTHLQERVFIKKNIYIFLLLFCWKKKKISKIKKNPSRLDISTLPSEGGSYDRRRAREVNDVKLSRSDVDRVVKCIASTQTITRNV